MENKELIEKFKQYFNQSPDSIYFSPGRINLIGEHVDYNGGSCLPIAISIGIKGIVKKTNTPLFELISYGYNKNKVYKIALDNLCYDKEHFFANYPLGIIKFLNEKYPLKYGFKLFTYSNLPSGAGLSSSACIELLVAKIIIDFNNINLSEKELAQLGQRVENEFIGLKSGILDQFVIASAKKDFAISLDTNTLSANHIPFVIPKGYSLVIANTNKKRTLADSKYNQRVAECEQALKIINQKYLKRYPNISSLDINKLSVYKNYLNDTLYKRTKYVLEENLRVKQAINYLANNDFISFAKILEISHQGQKEDYEVSGLELDCVVENAIKLGAIGARMTGAGFGGCAFFIARTDQVEEIKDKLSKIYYESTNIMLSFYLVDSANKVSLIEKI